MTFSHCLHIHDLLFLYRWYLCKPDLIRPSVSTKLKVQITTKCLIAEWLCQADRSTKKMKGCFAFQIPGPGQGRGAKNSKVLKPIGTSTLFCRVPQFLKTR